MPFYDERDQLWETIPGVEFMDFDERQEADYLYTQILDDVEFHHVRPQDSQHWDAFMDFMGFARNGDVWDWQEFQEWYSEV